MNVDAARRSVRRLTNLVQQPQAGGWYKVIRNDAGPTRVDIYDEIGGSWLFGGVSAADFVAELAQINGDLEVHINSPGGDVFDGLAIYNSLAQRPGNVTTVVDGLAASAASFIAQAGKVRTIAPGAMMMIHDAAGACYGNASDMRELADLLDKVSDNLASIYADRTGRADGWRDAMKAETWYTADEAVAAGLAHRVAERPEEQALAAVAGFDLSVFAHVPDRLRDSTPSASAALTEDVRSLIGEEVAAQLRAAVAPQVTAKALPVHHTATVDEPWDGPAAVAAMPNDDTVLEYCFAWQSDEAAATPHKEGDGDADDQKANYKFPHHKTKGGPANLAACRNGLARLEGSSIPEGDKAGVKAHLQAHLDDAGHGDDDKGAQDHAGMPGWLNTHDTAPFPAWLADAEEATK
ncbi:ATP-dependent Clp endopeptidase proteolytic subunit ClpP [Streptomyces sp. Ag109_O5-1]|uniref:head maturation protease, ClpP-related n=1 Tax=Streptomyces sp. Ag109_O5-1 TaxID=1938851 RepID=UPI000FB7028B|nr:head maturation protease, ClpP-related [Streptomyces sp. Ag109_O5-1]RPE40265.1 ATP-dependent Clp endopeptidase proteolytic subunit ClpP [Streptomyces sp. Ag109_O5-1]